MHRQSTEPNSPFTPADFELSRKAGSLYQIAPDIAGLRQMIVNVFFIGEPGANHWVIVDAGIAGSAAAILQAAEERFGVGSKPSCILLTHGHFDHVGGLKTLADHWDVPIYAHPLELPYLTGRSSYPPPDPTVGGGGMAYLAGLYPKKPIDLGNHIQPLPNDGTLPDLPGWRWFHTPGHTAGHVSFFRENDRALIAGDAFVTTRQEAVFSVMAQKPELNGPPAYFTPDWDAARESVRHLASMNPKIVATGHGVPMSGDRMLQELRVLARDFDEIARPVRGRYVRQPAQANRDGVTYVPPGFISRNNRIFLGVMLAAGLILGLSAAARRR